MMAAGLHKGNVCLYSTSGEKVNAYSQLYSIVV